MEIKWTIDEEIYLWEILLLIWGGTILYSIFNAPLPSFIINGPVFIISYIACRLIHKFKFRY